MKPIPILWRPAWFGARNYYREISDKGRRE